MFNSLDVEEVNPIAFLFGVFVQTGAAILIPITILGLLNPTNMCESGALGYVGYRYEKVITVLVDMVLVGLSPVPGLVGGRYFPFGGKSGKWVWALPFLLYVLDVMGALSRSTRDDAFRYYVSTPVGASLSVSVWLCCAYSIGIVLGQRLARTRNRSLGDGYQPV